MISFPNCKINLGLHIVNKRADGFHNLETIFYPIPLSDAIEIITSSSTSGVTYTSSGNTIDGAADDNLCIKAYHLLKKDFPNEEIIINGGITSIDQIKQLLFLSALLQVMDLNDHVKKLSALLHPSINLGYCLHVLAHFASLRNE